MSRHTKKIINKKSGSLPHSVLSKPSTMDTQQMFGETMLDIAPMLDDFPMELYEGSPGSDTTFESIDPSDLLSPVLLQQPPPPPQDESSLQQEDQPLMSPIYGEFIDPDMFLNGVVKRESESDCSTSSRRNTPSPSGSNESYESCPSSEYSSWITTGKVPLNNILLDSPPVSPENPVNPAQLVMPAGANIIRVGTAQLPIVQKPTCLSNLGDLKKIKLLPKGVSSIKTAIPKGATKKTIVLPAKDYQALMKNMKSQNLTRPILIKATSASAFTVVNKPTDKPVLPKPASQSCAVPMGQAVAAQEEPVSRLPPPPPAVMPVKREGSVDERAIKRHQRMIKNRESAFLSRVRKKEYVTSLEQQIDGLVQENNYLKNENNKLLERLKFKCACGAAVGSVNMLTKQITPNVRKNTAIVLAMLFMVSLNFGPLGNLLTNSNSNSALMEKTADLPHHQRNLLWLEESSVFNARNADINANSTDSFDESSSRGGGGVPEEPFSICPFSVNQTENIRLASELRRWIGENGFKNLTDRDGDDMSISSFSEMFALKDTIDSMYRQMKDISSQMETFQKRSKLTASRKRGGQLKNKKSRGLQLHQQNARKAGGGGGELAFYYPGFSRKYAQFFEEIGRRDDTFYLVSFSGEHLLLPALAHNKTNRPKMSLMLPAVMDNVTHPSDKFTLMQIDCEVMNTSLIQIREKTIPGDLLRPHGKTAADGFAKEATKRPERGTNYVAHNESNVSSTASGNAYHKHPASRPFFVQRMSEHMKNDLDLN